MIQLFDIHGVPCLYFQKAEEPYYTLDEMEAFVLKDNQSICVARDTASECLIRLCNAIRRCQELNARREYTGKELIELYAKSFFCNVDMSFFEYDFLECREYVTWLLDASELDKLILEGWTLDIGEEPPLMGLAFQFALEREKFLAWASEVVDYGKQFCTPYQLNQLESNFKDTLLKTGNI